MYNVPQVAVIYKEGNPVGEPMVWAEQRGSQDADDFTWFIRCFVPASGV
jgi:hypothetical protein